MRTHLIQNKSWNCTNITLCTNSVLFKKLELDLYVSLSSRLNLVKQKAGFQNVFTALLPSSTMTSVRPCVLSIPSTSPCAKPLTPIHHDYWHVLEGFFVNLTTKTVPRVQNSSKAWSHTGIMSELQNKSVKLLVRSFTSHLYKGVHGGYNCNLIVH